MRKGTIDLIHGSLKLRRYVIEDIPVLYEHLGLDHEMMKYTGWNPYTTSESTAGFIQNIIDEYDKSGSDYSWIIEMHGESVGIIGAYDYCQDSNSIEIGYSIFHKYWGNNLATQAVSAVCDYLMNQEKISVIKAWSATENIGSVKALEKNGFVSTKITEAGINVEGTKFDQVFFEKRS